MTISELNEMIDNGKITKLRYIHPSYGEIDWYGDIESDGVYWVNDGYVTVVDDEE
jgi:hypothetical protein